MKFEEVKLSKFFRTDREYLDYLKNSKLNSNLTKTVDKFDSYRKVIGKSQNGEDSLLQKIFDLIGTKSKYCVEFGAGNGQWLSNTYYFRSNCNWESLLLEANEQTVDATKLPNLHQATVTSSNINQLFNQYGVPKNFDLLSIDIDSYDFHVWNGLVDYRPNVVIVETNTGLPNNVPLIIPEDKQSNGNQFGYFGANMLAFYYLGKSKGYEFVTNCNQNAVFVSRELCSKLHIKMMSEKECIDHYNSRANFTRTDLIAKSLNTHKWLTFDYNGTIKY